MTVGIDLDCLEGIRVADFTQFEGRAVVRRKSRLAREAPERRGEADGLPLLCRRRLSL